jgi:hypothetical protein
MMGIRGPKHVASYNEYTIFIVLCYSDPTIDTAKYVRAYVCILFRLCAYNIRIVYVNY